MCLQFTAYLYWTVRPATFTNHDGTLGTDENNPVGTAVAIDTAGNVYLARDVSRETMAQHGREQGKQMLIWRDHFQSHEINVNSRDKAGPYWHAVLNAIDLPQEIKP